MAHLAEHPAVRGSDALDRAERAVDVPFFIHGYIAFRIAVLRGDLSVCKETVEALLRRNETALAVGCRIDIDAAEGATE